MIQETPITAKDLKEVYASALLTKLTNDGLSAFQHIMKEMMISATEEKTEREIEFPVNLDMDQRVLIKKILRARGFMLRLTPGGRIFAVWVVT